MTLPTSAAVLVVEDNADLAKALVDNLRLEGYRVSHVADGEAALNALLREPPDLVLLDVMLPGIDGYAVLRQARAAGYGGLVLMLTARGEEADKVRGLRSGADDYVSKPFGLLELLARVDALLRRAPGASAVIGDPGAATFEFGQIRIDVLRRSVSRSGTEVALTPREFDLLLALAQQHGAIASRVQLLRQVWGHSGVVESRTVDTHIAELRRKLELDPAHPEFILTVRKAGYRLQR